MFLIHASDPTLYPATPGCFLLRDSAGKVIFVGKATNLRRRLSELPLEKNIPAGSQRPHKRYLELGAELLARADTLELILLHDEAEGIFLINALIARYHPTFNLATLIEPVGVGYIVLTAERYPRLLPLGKKRAQHAPLAGKVFGPFPGGPVRDLVLKAVSEQFGLRTCDPMPQRACLLAEINTCCAPCEQRVSLEEYTQRVENAAHLLSASPAELIEALENQASAAAAAQATVRGAHLSERNHKIIAGYRGLAQLSQGAPTQDAIYCAQGLAVIASYLEGKLHGVQSYPTGSELGGFIAAFYTAACPDELICQDFPEAEQMAALLQQRCGHAVTLSIPAGGAAEVQLDVARINHQQRVKAAA
jgi:excinuclease ABC subunit C